VIVRRDDKRRGFWSLGKIVEVYPGRDDVIRGASVRVFSGGKCSIQLNRSIQHLYPLEINVQGDDSMKEIQENQPPDEE
jgi:hypothetical protein